MDRFFPAWSSLRSFNALPRQERNIVFYAEGPADWPHLGPILEELARGGRSLCYVTSDADDRVLTSPPEGVRSFYVGTGTTRTRFFRLVDATVLVMTLPDLETFHLKRSVHPVHYVYVFHSIVSSHMTYRKGAFDAYDTIFCVGPHHAAEVRRSEEVYGLRRKELVEHGYARLDRILEAAAQRPPFSPTRVAARKIVLAPSWGECSFIEAAYGPDLLTLLLQAGHALVLRLHPMTVRRFPQLATTLSATLGEPNFRVETDMGAQQSLLESDLMISDWSGAALEYAFGLERPVLFIDTPKKVNNPDYERLGLVSLEEALRSELGGVVAPGNLREVLPQIETLSAEPAAFRTRLQAARQRWIYNVGRSAAVGASHVALLADTARDRVAARADATPA